MGVHGRPVQRPFKACGDMVRIQLIRGRSVVLANKVSGSQIRVAIVWLYVQAHDLCWCYTRIGCSFIRVVMDSEYTPGPLAINKKPRYC
jgi:hypothetical protein